MDHYVQFECQGQHFTHKKLGYSISVAFPWSPPPQRDKAVRKNKIKWCRSSSMTQAGCYTHLKQIAPSTVEGPREEKNDLRGYTLKVRDAHLHKDGWGVKEASLLNCTIMQQRRSFPTPVASHANAILGSLPGRLDSQLHSRGSNHLNNANNSIEISLELKKLEMKHVLFF